MTQERLTLLPTFTKRRLNICSETIVNSEGHPLMGNGSEKYIILSGNDWLVSFTIANDQAKNEDRFSVFVEKEKKRKEKEKSTLEIGTFLK